MQCYIEYQRFFYILEVKLGVCSFTAHCSWYNEYIFATLKSGLRYSFWYLFYNSGFQLLENFECASAQMLHDLLLLY